MSLVPVVAPLLFKRVRAGIGSVARSARERVTLPSDVIRTMNAQHAETTQRLDTHSTKLNILMHEVLPNNGGSLRDAVDNLGLEGRRHRAKLSARTELKDRGQFEFRPDGNVDWTNEALRLYVGQSENVTNGRHWTAMFDRADRDRLAHELEQITFERASARIHTKLRRVTPAADTGGGRVELLDVELSISVVPDPADLRNVLCYSVTVRKTHPTGPQPVVVA